MKKINTLSFAGIGVLAALSFSFCGSKAVKSENLPMNVKGFAVVELFTSEGCSSCPPADDAMIKLAKEFPEHVYFLGYHVDYWDYIGWKDQFSNSDYTNRQNKYAEIFKLNSIYTPQAIINGEAELVGSRENQLRTIIQQKLTVGDSVAIAIVATKIDGEKVSVTYNVAGNSRDVLNIALVQVKASSDVKRGENKGHQLNHINVVRELKTINIDKGVNSSVDFKIPSGLTSKDIKIIAFEQNKGNMKIVAAGEASVQ